MSPRPGWTRSPHAGGSPIPPSLQQEVRLRILAYASKNYAGRFSRIDVRFRGRFCYLDAYREPDRPPKALLRALGETEKQYCERLRASPSVSDPPLPAPLLRRSRAVERGVLYLQPRALRANGIPQRGGIRDS